MPVAKLAGKNGAIAFGTSSGPGLFDQPHADLSLFGGLLDDELGVPQGEAVLTAGRVGHKHLALLGYPVEKDKMAKLGEMPRAHQRNGHAPGLQVAGEGGWVTLLVQDAVQAKGLGGALYNGEIGPAARAPVIVLIGPDRHLGGVMGWSVRVETTMDMAVGPQP